MFILKMKADEDLGKAINTTGINGMLWIRYFEKGIIISNRNHGKVKLNWIDAFILFDELERRKKANEILRELES